MATATLFALARSERLCTEAAMAAAVTAEALMEADDHGQLATHHAASTNNAAFLRAAAAVLRGHAGRPQLFAEEDRKRRTPLHLAAWNGAREAVAVLLDEVGVPRDPRDEGGYTPLFFAVFRKHAGLACELVERWGCSAAVPSFPHESGVLPLHQACISGEAGLVPVLARGVGADALDANGTSPLALALRHRHLGAFEAVLAAGADAWLANAEGNTALHLACCAGLEPFVAVLLPLARDEDLRRANRNGLTAADMAAADGHTALAEAASPPGATAAHDDDDCAICCCLLLRPVRLACGHVFCARCAALALSAAALCPYRCATEPGSPRPRVDTDTERAVAERHGAAALRRREWTFLRQRASDLIARWRPGVDDGARLNEENSCATTTMLPDGTAVPVRLTLLHGALLAIHALPVRLPSAAQARAAIATLLAEGAFMGHGFGAGGVALGKGGSVSMVVGVQLGLDADGALGPLLAALGRCAVGWRARLSAASAGACAESMRAIVVDSQPPPATALAVRRGTVDTADRAVRVLAKRLGGTARVYVDGHCAWFVKAQDLTLSVVYDAAADALVVHAPAWNGLPRSGVALGRLCEGLLALNLCFAPLPGAGVGIDHGGDAVLVHMRAQLGCAVADTVLADALPEFRRQLERCTQCCSAHVLGPHATGSALAHRTSSPQQARCYLAAMSAFRDAVHARRAGGDHTEPGPLPAWVGQLLQLEDGPLRLAVAVGAAPDHVRALLGLGFHVLDLRDGRLDDVLDALSAAHVLAAHMRVVSFHFHFAGAVTTAVVARGEAAPCLRLGARLLPVAAVRHAAEAFVALHGVASAQMVLAVRTEPPQERAVRIEDAAALVARGAWACGFRIRAPADALRDLAPGVWALVGEDAGGVYARLAAGAAPDDGGEWPQEEAALRAPPPGAVPRALCAAGFCESLDSLVPLLPPRSALSCDALTREGRALSALPPTAAEPRDPQTFAVGFDDAARPYLHGGAMHGLRWGLRVRVYAPRRLVPDQPGAFVCEATVGQVGATTARLRVEPGSGAHLPAAQGRFVAAVFAPALDTAGELRHGFLAVTGRTRADAEAAAAAASAPLDPVAAAVHARMRRAGLGERADVDERAGLACARQLAATVVPRATELLGDITGRLLAEHPLLAPALVDPATGQVRCAPVVDPWDGRTLEGFTIRADQRPPPAHDLVRVRDAVLCPAERARVESAAVELGDAFAACSVPRVPPFGVPADPVFGEDDHHGPDGEDGEAEADRPAPPAALARLAELLRSVEIGAVLPPLLWRVTRGTLARSVAVACGAPPPHVPPDTGFVLAERPARLPRASIARVVAALCVAGVGVDAWVDHYAAITAAAVCCVAGALADDDDDAGGYAAAVVAAVHGAAWPAARAPRCREAWRSRLAARLDALARRRMPDMRAHDEPRACRVVAASPFDVYCDAALERAGAMAPAPVPAEPPGGVFVRGDALLEQWRGQTVELEAPPGGAAFTGRLLERLARWVHFRGVRHALVPRRLAGVRVEVLHERAGEVLWRRTLSARPGESDCTLHDGARAVAPGDVVRFVPFLDGEKDARLPVFLSLYDFLPSLGVAMLDRCPLTLKTRDRTDFPGTGGVCEWCDSYLRWLPSRLGVEHFSLFVATADTVPVQLARHFLEEAPRAPVALGDDAAWVVFGATFLVVPDDASP